MTGDVVYPPAAHSFVLSAFTVEAVRRECYLVQRKHYDNLVAERDALKALLAEAKGYVLGRMPTADRTDLYSRIDAALREGK